jgi:mannose-6-phosphate isomerase-like protein (cupin superfamily)
MTRSLLLPFAAILALATGLGLLGVAITLSQDPVAIAPSAVSTAPVAEARRNRETRPDTKPFRVDAPVQLASGPGVFCVERLTLAPAEHLSANVKPGGSAVLVVETGTLAVRFDGAARVGQGLDAAQISTVLQPGEHVLILPGMLHVARNDGPATAVAFLIAIAPATPCPDLQDRTP